MKITTNHVPRFLIDGYELTEKEKQEFDYVENIEETCCRFFKYKGDVYDLHEFTIIVPRSRAVGFEHGVDEDSPLLKWDGIQTDSYFSAVVVRYVDDCESVIVATVTC